MTVEPAIQNLAACRELLRRAPAMGDSLAAQAAEDDPREFPVRSFRWLAEEGWLAAPLTASLGGGGLGSEPGSTAGLLQVLKHVGRGRLPVGRIYEGHANALLLVQLFGSPEQLQRYATDAARDSRIFGVWNAEGGPTTLRFVPADGGRWRLEGGKLFASGLGRVQRPIVTGRLPDGGWQMAVVPMEQVQTRADFSWWQPLGMEATVSGAVDFTGVELGPEDLLGSPDSYYRDPWFSGGAIRFLAVHLGGAEAIYDAVRAYLRQTNQTEHFAQRERVAEMTVRVQAGDLWLRGAAEIADRPGADVASVIQYAGAARMAIEAICLDVIRGAERCVGARGLLKPWPFERLIRDLTMYLRQPAPDVIVERVGRHALESPLPAHALWSAHPEP